MPPEYAGPNSEEVEPEASAFVVTETQYQADNEKGDNGESGVVYLVVARRLQFAQSSRFSVVSPDALICVRNWG